MTAHYSRPVRIHIEKQSIRRLFYLGALSSIVILACALSFIYTRSLSVEFDNKIRQLSESLLEEKKRFLRNAVDRTIQLIEHERGHTRREFAGMGMTEEQLEDAIKEQVSSLIRETRLIDNGYLWVNHIIKYEGGDNYAIRAVHPNLPHTEGSWLSTNTEDQQGRRPYLEELNGIKKDGELFFDYDFKKMDSDEIVHKMSYAKLYEPYDWVVATGVYIDDVDRLIQDEGRRMQASYTRQVRLSLSISAVVVLLATLCIVFFERHITQLVSNYEEATINYTKSLEEASSTDVLTGLSNRLMLDEIFSYEINQSHRYGSTFSILLLDLDHFKNVNDTHGHQAGDNALREAADILRANSRQADTVGRWGGEEFLLILPKTDAGQAMIFAEKIRKSFASHDFPFGTLTCSIGISAYRKNDSRETMMERADKGLYCAKQNGRNQVVHEKCT